jgi:hypothetical protein
MNANKTILTVTVEVLSIDSTPALLSDVAEQIRGEFHNGSLTSSDGDRVTWKTESTPVEF